MGWLVKQSVQARLRGRLLRVDPSRSPGGLRELQGFRSFTSPSPELVAPVGRNALDEQKPYKKSFAYLQPLLYLLDRRGLKSHKLGKPSRGCGSLRSRLSSNKTARASMHSTADRSIEWSPTRLLSQLTHRRTQTIFSSSALSAGNCNRSRYQSPSQAGGECQLDKEL